MKTQIASFGANPKQYIKHLKPFRVWVKERVYYHEYHGQ